MRHIVDKIEQDMPSYKSIPFWSWNDKLEETELRKQIREMHELDMGGFFMHARGGLETEYLSEDWFDCIRVCMNEAKKLGMQAWSYDENGWPSGFAGGALLKDKKNLAIAMEYKFGPFPQEDENIIAVYKKMQDGSFVWVTQKEQPKTSTEKNLMQKQNVDELQNVYSDAEETENTHSNTEEYLILYKRYDKSYVDTLNPEVTELFIKETHKLYQAKLAAEDFGTGKVMPGFFTDEPQYYRWGNAYSDTLPEQFEKTYGYSIFEKLPAVFFDFEGAEKFRYDYYYLMHKLFINSFIKKIYEWCEENNVELTGHAVEETSLDGQMMCIGGVMPFYQYEHIPGIDYLGRGISDDIAPKQLGSVCAQLGQKKAISEMFGCCGWDVSPRELKRIAEVQYVNGVNLMCQHLYPYSEKGQRKRDYPLHYSKHNPWSAKMKDFNTYFARLGSTVAQGTEFAPILVIHPIHGAYCKYKKYQNTLGEIEHHFFALSRLLGENQIPYHYGDEWMMEDMAQVEGDRIKIGCCTYEAVIVPFTYSLDKSTCELLKTYMEHGGKVWLYQGVPERVDGEVAELPWLQSNVSLEEIKALRDVIIEKDGNNVPQLRKMTRLLGESAEKRIVYITNIREEELENITVTLPAGNWANYSMLTKELLPVCGEEENGNVVVTLSFTDGESYVFVSGEAIQDVDRNERDTNIDFGLLEQKVMNADSVALKKQVAENCEMDVLVQKTYTTVDVKNGERDVMFEEMHSDTEGGNNSQKVTSEEMHQDTFIKIPNVVTLAKPVENCLTLDTAALSKDGIEYEEPLAIVGIRDNLLRERYEGYVYLKFTYQVEELPTKLRFAIEPMYEQVWVNGTEVVPNKDKYWFDKAFATADIAALTKQGTNEIVVKVYHKQRDYVYYVLYGDGDITEALRNCLSFDVEIESMYLLGEFGLRCDGTFTERQHRSVTFEGEFVLVKQPETVSSYDVVRSGFPFYAGEMPLTFSYEYRKGLPTVLNLDGRFATAEVMVNGIEAGTMLFKTTMDLADYLQEGKNTITVTLCNSMRNTMGPHHRDDPEPYSVGPHTFSFEKGWNGRECAGYIEWYAFVRYGLTDSE